MNLVTLDVREVSNATNYFVIAEGTVDRHVTALAQNVDHVLRVHKTTPAHTEGMREGKWVVLDYIDFMVHLFTPELRSYYSLEEVWKHGHIIQVPVDYGRTISDPSGSIEQQE